MIEQLKDLFPKFTSLYRNADPEEILPGIGETEIVQIETEVGCPLPDSYKSFLKKCRGIWLFGGPVQFGSQHPFRHDFPPLEKLSPQQIQVVKQRGGAWPPPSDGMLCFAKYFLEDDGDQVLFKTDEGLVDGEYPVYYYAHSDSPASIRMIANGFHDFIENYCIQLFDEEE